MQTTWKLRFLGAVSALLLSAVVFFSQNDGLTGQLWKRCAPPADIVLSNYSSDSSLSHPFEVPRLHEPDYPTVVKRDRTLSYSAAVCRGQALYRKILDAFKGIIDEAQRFTENDLRNGWDPESRQGKFSFWDDALKQMGKNVSVGERVPTREETILVDAPLKNPFKSAAGNTVTGRDIETQAHYDLAFIPSRRAMVGIETRSPWFTVKNRLQRHKKPTASADISKLVPSLHRLSDFMWMYWTTVSPNPNNLRYIMRDNVNNEDSVAIMNDIFKKYGSGKPLAWPGLYFTLAQEEGQALLGTPNGYTVAYLLSQRARELGMRVVAVSIFCAHPDQVGNEWFQMLWDLRPV
ncbi:MAG: hypothetical protein Q9216_004512 [Gyalolechia sp. 2 TL-2023]